MIQSISDTPSKQEVGAFQFLKESMDDLLLRVKSLAPELSQSVNLINPDYGSIKVEKTGDGSSDHGQPEGYLQQYHFILKEIKDYVSLIEGTAKHLRKITS